MPLSLFVRLSIRHLSEVWTNGLAMLSRSRPGPRSTKPTNLSPRRDAAVDRKGITMEKFAQLTGVAAPLPIINLDTDKIFPAVYLKTIKRTGLSQWLFQEIRFRPDGSEHPDFVLNQAPYRNAKILIEIGRAHV